MGCARAACRQGGCQGGRRGGGGCQGGRRGGGGSGGRRRHRGAGAAAAYALAVRGHRRAGEAGNRSALAGTAVRLWAGPALPRPRRRAPPIGRRRVRRSRCGGRGPGCAWQAGGEYDGTGLDLRPSRRRAPNRHCLVPQLPRGGTLPRRRARCRAARTARLRTAHGRGLARMRPHLRAQRCGAPPSITYGYSLYYIWSQRGGGRCGAPPSTRPAASCVPLPEPPPSNGARRSAPYLHPCAASASPSLCRGSMAPRASRRFTARSSRRGARGACSCRGSPAGSST